MKHFQISRRISYAGFGSIYELQAAKKSSETPFIEPPQAHAMPEKVYSICSLKIDGEWRLAAFLEDMTVSLFGMKSAQLTRLMKLEKTEITYLAPIPTTNAILSNMTWQVEGKDCTSIELDVPGQNSQFGVPRTIFPAEKSLWCYSHCVCRNSIDGRLYAVMFDMNSESLHVFDFC